MKKLAKKLLAFTMAACFTVAIMGCENQNGGVKQCPKGKKCEPAACKKTDCCKKGGKCAADCKKACCKKKEAAAAK